MKTTLRILLVIALAVICSVTSMAQLTKGFRGKVIGTDGKPLVGATVVFTNLDNTSQTWEVKTDEHGYYTQAGLPFADNGYDIRVKTDDMQSNPKNKKSKLMTLQVVNFDLREDLAEQKKKIETSPASEAKNLYQMGAYEEAIAKANEAITKDDNVKVAMFIKGACMEQLDDTDGAIKAFESYSKKFPDADNSTDVLGYLGKLYEKKGDKKKAAFYKKAFTAKGGKIINQTFNEGVAAYKAGNFAKAVELFKKAAKENPEDADCHRELGRSLVQLGKYQETIDELKIYLKMKPDADDAETWKQAITGLEQMIAAQGKDK